LLPAFALATELDRRGHHVALVTDERGAKIPGKPAFLPAHVLPAGRLGKNPIALAKGLSAIWKGRAMALRLFESFEPACVVGFGGYPALPALLAARAARIPTVIHEQNAVLGRVNRLLAKRVDAIATAYLEVERLDPKLWGKVHRVGNPVRPEVLELRGEAFPAFSEESLFRVLVTGGSQGASILSEVVPDGAAPPLAGDAAMPTRGHRGSARALHRAPDSGGTGHLFRRHGQPPWRNAFVHRPGRSLDHCRADGSGPPGDPDPAADCDG